MGMYDTIHSSFPIFGDDNDQDLQTKDLECILACYWIDPAGRLYQVNYTGTADLYPVPEEERKHRHHVLDWKPNGRRGRVAFVPLDGQISVIAKNGARVELLFVSGVISNRAPYLET